MTREDVIKMLTLLKSAYPAFYAKMTRKEADDTIALWLDMFVNDDPRAVVIAIKDIIATHDGYPPTIAAIKNRAKELMRSAAGIDTPDDLWNKFAKACGNGIYCAAYEFEKLPPVLKKFAGSPNRIREYAMMDSDTFNSVVRGQFFKRIEDLQEQEEREALMQPQTKALLREVAQKIGIRKMDDALLPEAGTDIESENTNRNRVLDALEQFNRRCNHGN